MNLDITLANYRCFPDSAPATISIGPGFTALIGANNAGKSSLLKFFYEFRPLFGSLSSSGWMIQTLTRPQGFTFGQRVMDPTEVFHKGNDRDLHIGIRLIDGTSSANVTRAEITVKRNINTAAVTLFAGDRRLEMDATGLTYLQTETDIILRQNDRNIGNVSHLLQAFTDLNSTLYIGSFRNPVNIGTRQNYFDIHVGQAFIQAWRGFKSGAHVAQNEAARRVEKDIAHIFELADFQVNAGPEEQTLQMFMNDKSYKLGEVGSGMAQFLLVLANAAMNNPKYVLIDEPELNLHPALQIDFLTALGSYAGEGVVYATHSLGLARATAERIFSLRKQSEIESRVTPLESTPRLSEFLGEMSFGGYRELGFDQVLLVEGTTDVTAVQQLLRLLKKDHKVVLLPLGGSAMINGRPETELQLQELTRISPKIAALIDSDHGEAESLGSDRQAFCDVCSRAGIRCHVLERRAIENYWTERAIQLVKRPSVGALQPFEKVSRWAKHENWLIARRMIVDELTATDLGQFLVSLCPD